MKDQYAGDVGDYVKLGLLRALFSDRSLAVNWFRTANDIDSGDGRFVDYLEERHAAEWRSYDPVLYDHLKSMVHGGQRSIASMQQILEGAGREFFDALIERPSARSVWFARFNTWLTVRDAAFLDPDNGISSDQSLPSLKSVTRDEIEHLLGRVRTLMVYHHQTRAKGGHMEEISRIGQWIAPSHSYRSACAIRAGRRSPRVFFLIGADREIWMRAESFCKLWQRLVTFHALTMPPDHLGLTPGASAWHRVDAMEARGLM